MARDHISGCREVADFERLLSYVELFTSYELAQVGLTWEVVTATDCSIKYFFHLTGDRPNYAVKTLIVQTVLMPLAPPKACRSRPALNRVGLIR